MSADNKLPMITVALIHSWIIPVATSPAFEQVQIMVEGWLV